MWSPRYSPRSSPRSSPSAAAQPCPDLNTSVHFNRDKLLKALVEKNMSVFYDMWRSYARCPADVWKHLRETHATCNDQREDKYNSLHFAVVRNDLEVVKAILYGPDPEVGTDAAHWKFDFLHARTSRGWTALHLATVSENEQMLRFLMEQYNSVKRRPDKDWNFADYCWMTPLHFAVLKNLEVQMQMLLEWKLYSRHVNARDFFQRTPLHMAACHRPLKVGRFVECKGVDLNATDCVMHTPLHWAICFGREEIVKCLVEKLRDVEAIDLDIEGRSALEMALDDVMADPNGDPNEGAETENSTRPEDCDREFLTGGMFFKVHCGRVSTRIRNKLLTIPAVKAEGERSHRSLQIYLNATNSTLVVAALIANASFGRSPPMKESVEGLKSYFFVARSLAFYTSIMALVASFLALHSLGKTLFGLPRLKEIRFALKRISVILGVSIGGFLGAFFDANWISTSALSGAYFNLYQTFAIAGLVCCFVAVLGMPFTRGKIKFYEDQQESLSKQQTDELHELVSKLYQEKLEGNFYEGLWKVECARLNVVKAFTSFRPRTAGRNRQEDQLKAHRYNYYIDFVRTILNVPGIEPFKLPSQIEAIWMWVSESSKHLGMHLPEQLSPLEAFFHMVFYRVYTILLIPLWGFPGRDFRMFILCTLFGDHFSETYCHGKLYPKPPPKPVPAVEGQQSTTRAPGVEARVEDSWRAMFRRMCQVSMRILAGVKSMVCTILAGVKSMVCTILAGVKSMVCTILAGVKSMVCKIKNWILAVEERIPVETTPRAQDIEDFAGAIWRKRRVSSGILAGVKSMENKIKPIERVYEERSAGVSHSDPSTAEEARYLMSFLDRLPRGIFYWISIWFFPKEDHRNWSGFFYWMNFWCTNDQITPRKFPIVTFYQGYVFQRDHEKSRQISREAKEAVETVLEEVESLGNHRRRYPPPRSPVRSAESTSST